MVHQPLHQHHYPCHSDDDDGSFNVPYPFLIHTVATPVIGHHEYSNLAAQFDPLLSKEQRSPRIQPHNMHVQLIPNSFSSSTQAVLLEKRDIQHEHNKNKITKREQLMNPHDNDNNNDDKIMKLNLLLYPSHTVSSIDESIIMNDNNDNDNNTNENGTKYNIFSPRKMIMNTNFYESMYPDPTSIAAPVVEKQQHQNFMKNILLKKKHHRRSHSLPSANDYNQLCNNNSDLIVQPSPPNNIRKGGLRKNSPTSISSTALLTTKPDSINSRSRSNPMNMIHLPWTRRNSNNKPTPLSLEPQETQQEDHQLSSFHHNNMSSPTSTVSPSMNNHHTKYTVLDDPIETIRINHKNNNNSSNHRRSLSIFQRKPRNSNNDSTKTKKSTKGKKYQLFTPTFDDMKDRALQQPSFLDDNRNDETARQQEEPIFLSSSLLLSSIYHPLHQPTKNDETLHQSKKKETLHQLKKNEALLPSGQIKKATTTTTKTATTTTVTNLVHHKPSATSFLTTTGYYNEWNKQRSSEQHASEWQCNIPDYTDVIIATKVCQFLEYCHSIECYFNLNTLIHCNRLELLQFIRGDHPHPLSKTNNIPSNHRNHVEYLLDCGNDITNVCGYYRSYPQENDNDNDINYDNNNNVNDDVIDMGECIIDPDNYREVLILERSRQFICIIRGTSDEQSGMKAYSKLNKHRQPATITINSTVDDPVSSTTNNNNNTTTTVYRDPYVAYQGLQSNIFTLLDELTEANPFYDVTFIGHSFASTIATLAGYQYAISRPTIRVSVYGTQTMNWKVGLLDFRMAVHSIPNLRIVRLEHHHDFHHQSMMNNNSISHHQSQSGGYHVGHLIRMVPPSSTSVRIVDSKEQQLSVTMTSTLDDDKQFAYAYKFGYGDPLTTNKAAQQHHQHPTISTSKTTSTKTTATSSMVSSIMSKCRTGGGVVEKNIDEYVDTLEALGSLHWVTTFVNDNLSGGGGGHHHTGKGYDNNEHRELA